MTTQRGILFKTLAAILAASALLVPTRSMAADVDTDGIGDESDAVPCDPRATTVAYAPAKGQQGALVFEDLWPSKGDLDFNDVSLTYNYIFFLDGSGRVSSMQASVNLLAAGGTIPNSVRLHLPVAADAASKIKLNLSDGVVHDVAPEPGEHELVIPLIADVNAALGDTIANSTSTKASVPGVPLNLYIEFANPVAVDLSQAPFDLYIERTQEPGHQIHQVTYPGTDTMDVSLFGTDDDGSTPSRHFVDSDGLPFALTVPSSFQWPSEGVSISSAYPDITAWAVSGGATHADWYQTDVQTGSVWTGGAGGTPPPLAVLLGPTDPSEDVKCTPWKGSVEFGLGPYTYPYGTASDPSGNVIVAGVTNANQNTVAYVTKFDASKNQVWTKTFGGSGYTYAAGSTSYSAEAYGVATDPQGNIYISGQVLGSIADEPYAGNGNTEHYVAKLDPSGTVLWVTHLALTGYFLNGWGVTVAADGSIDTVGYSSGPAAYVAQLDSDGNLRFITPPQLANVIPFGVATDPSGAIYISGYSSNGNPESFVAKYSPTGTWLWSRNDHSLYSYSQFNSVAVDSHGNAYVAAYREASNYCYTYCNYCGLNCSSCGTQCTSVYDSPLWKYDTNGNEQWVTTVGQNSEGLTAAIGPDDSPVYAGIAWSSLDGQPYDGNDDYFAAKVNPNGSIAWVRQGGDGPNFYAEALSACVDPSGSVFVAGYTNGDLISKTPTPNGQPQTFVVKYDANGTLQ